LGIAASLTWLVGCANDRSFQVDVCPPPPNSGAAFGGDTSVTLEMPGGGFVVTLLDANGTPVASHRAPLSGSTSLALGARPAGGSVLVEGVDADGTVLASGWAPVADAVCVCLPRTRWELYATYTQDKTIYHDGPSAYVDVRSTSPRGLRLQRSLSSNLVEVDAGGSVTLGATWVNDGVAAVHARLLSLSAVSSGQAKQTMTFPAHSFSAGESLDLSATLTLPGVGSWYVYPSFVDEWGNERAAPGIDVHAGPTGSPLTALPLSTPHVEWKPGDTMAAAAGFSNPGSAPQPVYYGTITIRAPGQKHMQTPFNDFRPPLAGSDPYPASPISVAPGPPGFYSTAQWTLPTGVDADACANVKCTISQGTCIYSPR